MDRFAELRTFVEVAEKGGFAPAARALGLSPPAATRAVSALEARLGVRLFVRTTRVVRLTEAGGRFLLDARRLLADLAEAEAAAAGIHAAPRGELAVTAPVLFGRRHVAPLIGAFLDLHPDVSARCLFVDRNINLLEEGADVAVRIGHLPDSSLVATAVGRVRAVVVGAPAYVAAHGEPAHPADLAAHRLIHPVGVRDAPDWEFQDQGRPLSVRTRPRLRVSTNDAALELALQGWGLTRLLSYQVAEEVAGGLLRPVLAAFEPDPLPVHLLHAEGARVSAKVRAFVDFAAARLRANPALR